MAEETVTFELPVDATARDDKVTVDTLFTAIDHGKAYHDHKGQYAFHFNDLENMLWEQAKEQLR